MESLTHWDTDFYWGVPGFHYLWITLMILPTSYWRDHFESVTAYTNVWKNACVCSSSVKLLCHAFRRFVTLWQITACLTKGSCPWCFASLCFISSVYVAIKITLSLSINGRWPCACTEIHCMNSEGKTSKKSTKTSIMLRFQRTLLYQHNTGCMLNEHSISYLTTQWTDMVGIARVS